MARSARWDLLMVETSSTHVRLLKTGLSHSKPECQRQLRSSQSIRGQRLAGLLCPKDRVLDLVGLQPVSADRLSTRGSRVIDLHKDDLRPKSFARYAQETITELMSTNFFLAIEQREGFNVRE